MSHYQIYIVYQYGSPKSLYSNFDPNPGVPIAAEGRGASGAEVQSTKEDRIEVGVQSTAQDRTGAEAEARNGTKGLQIGGETVTRQSGVRNGTREGLQMCGETVTHHLLPEGAGRIIVGSENIVNLSN